MAQYKRHLVSLVSTLILCSLTLSNAYGLPVTDIVNTKHNLSASGPGTLKATTESRVCVFCHTPHAGTVNTGEASAPLWNRTLSDTAVYSEYTSPSINAVDTGKPSGSSRMCLSCHDGALVIGNVNYAYGVLNAAFGMQGTDGDGTMQSGTGENTGFTRNLGTNLTNDHPISFTFDSALATADSELRDPNAEAHLGNRVPGVSNPIVPLENGKVQCISCHDPHIPKEKFLRLNRTQNTSNPTAGTFTESQDIVCIACHEKKGWSTSAHSNPLVADEIYTSTASDTREFAAGIQVWQAACLNCHDTHTVAGARMLLREGTDGGLVSGVKDGGIAAQEQTCYQCHSSLGESILTNVSNVPNLKGEFSRAYTKPVTTSQQGQVEELHRITSADFMEDQANIGVGMRHAECTDCHNPHRIIKNNTFNADPTVPDSGAHHDHNTPNVMHTNIASGALAGTWGVEPVYGSASFGSNPVSFDIKSGYAGVGASTAKASTHVTREYQICLKCHSNYAYGLTPPPVLSQSLGHNGVTTYTNQAMEFQAPVGDIGENQGTSGSAANHRSWHPVMDSTGRTVSERGGMNPALFNAPWQNDGVEKTGNQTMYCSDCHGSNTPYIDGDSSTYTVEPTADGAWGPHGSDKPFILKGEWDHSLTPADSSQLCFRCHNVDQYSTTNGTAQQSGYSGGSRINLHREHVTRIGSRLRCTWCHVAVPHGWRNKALLADITNDPEAASCAGVEPCNAAPYYQKAYLGGNSGGINWQPSGQWSSSDCGGGCGPGWMNQTCRNPQ
ncbi:MAG: multiheme protein [Thiomicrorhabdus sp.]|nr:MAG: multiheme protein [Thiomicrorhabdus sp.]